MDINQLMYFAEICRCGSISKAADNLHLSQQGLSISIKRLEKELGCTLFDRTNSGIELSTAGEFFKTEADEALEHINRIYQYFETTQKSKAVITAACTVQIIARIPVNLRNLLLRGTDDFEIKFIEDWTASCENLVHNNKANFGLVYGECDPTMFTPIKLDVLKQVFIVNRKSPLAAQDTVTLQDLANYPLIIPAERCRPGQVIRKMFGDAGVPLNVVFACDRPRQIIDMVSSDATLGARVIADDVSAEDLSSVKVLRLADEPFLLPICLIYKKGRKLSMQERFFMHLVMDMFDQ